MRRLLSGIQTRVDRLAEQVEGQSAESVDLEELIAILDEGRQRNAAGIQPPRLTKEEFTAWAEGLRASVALQDLPDNCECCLLQTRFVAFSIELQAEEPLRAACLELA